MNDRPGQFRSAWPRSKQKFRFRYSDYNVGQWAYAVRAYMRVIYTHIYIRHACTCTYAIERFILNIFCVNRRIILQKLIL